MALAVEAALTAVELLDAGWSRLTRGKTKKEEVKERAQLEDRALVLEGELAKAKVETRKLQTAIEEYKQLLLNLHREHGMGTEALGGEHALTEAETEELIKEVEQKINSPAFLEHLLAPPDTVALRGENDASPTDCRPVSSSGFEKPSEDTESPFSASSPSGLNEAEAAAAPNSSVRNSGGHLEVCFEADDDSECWQWVTAREMRGGIRASTEPCSGLEGEEEYEIVDGDEVVDGIALALARFIASHPDYRGLSAEELQKAIASGFKDSKGKGVIRALWNWSKFAYKASRWAAATYNVYRHPLMVRAVLLALVSSTRVIFGFTFA